MRVLKNILLTLYLCSHVWAWGDLGHRTVAFIAQKYLTKETSKVLDKILANDKGYDFSDAAKWADTQKFKRPWTKKWHYVDALDSPPTLKKSPPFECKLHYPKDCKEQGKDGCIITAIAAQTAAFLEPGSKDSATVRKEALMFLMHFIGDLHQPLHVEDYKKGGNEIPVCFANACENEKNNLHSVWDTYIPHKICGIPHKASDDEEKAAAAEWADKLFTLNSENGVSAQSECSDLSHPDKCTLAWAKDSNDWICKYVLTESLEWLEETDLSEGYHNGAVPIVEELIGKGGARLGAWLNALVSSLKVQIEDSEIEDSQQVLGDEHLGL